MYTTFFALMIYQSNIILNNYLVDKISYAESPLNYPG